MKKRKKELCSVKITFKRGSEKKIRERIVHNIDFDNTSLWDYCRIVGINFESGIRAERIIEKS